MTVRTAHTGTPSSVIPAKAGIHGFAANRQTVRVSSYHFTLNGDPHVVADGATVASLIEQLGLAGKRLAVEVNEEVVPRSHHAERALASGDQVEIVHAIGGG